MLSDAAASATRLGTATEAEPVIERDIAFH